MSETENDLVIEPEIVDPPEPIIPEPEPEEKVPAGVQRRIDEITKKRHEAQRELDRERAENAALRRELEAHKSQKPPEPTKTKPDGAPDPDKYPAGRYDPDYLEALTEFKADQKIKQHFEAQQKNTSAEERQRYIIAQENELRTKHPDYGDAVESYLSHEWVKTPQFQQVIGSAENPVEMAYYLGKNPAELEKIGAMNEVQALKYIGRLEDKIASTSPEQKKTVSDAPKPIAPLGSANSSTVSKDPAKMTMEQYAAWFKSQNR